MKRKILRSPIAYLVRYLLVPALTGSFIFMSCSRDGGVKDYFESHGYSYPSDSSGVSLFNVKYAGVGEDEIAAPGAREYIQEGLMMIREYFQKKEFGGSTLYIEAIIVGKPVLFRSEAGDIGLMVKVVAYGSGPPHDHIKLPVLWAGKDRRLWKVEDFAYFTRRGIDKWQFGGWVYQDRKTPSNGV